MPTRTSSRSTRTSNTVSHKLSTPSLSNARVSTTLRASSAVHADIPPETPETVLRRQIAGIFRDAQRTTASHRKLVVTLRKIQESCCYEPTNPFKKSLSEFDENDFNSEFMRCVVRIMPVKKSEGVGEKTVRFIGLFLRHATGRDNDIMGANMEDPEASTIPETPSMRLTGQLMETVMPLMTAKDKFVRYRATQLMAHVINSLDELDDDLFQKLRSGLLKRMRDKESMVRAQAVLGLGRLAGNQVEAGNHSDENSEADSDANNDRAAASGLLEKLLEVLQNDPSAEVRRSLLVNLPILPSTLPFLLERARDQDALTRRAVYSRLLPALGDFRHLSLSMREKLLRWGLRDRDENVRKAASRLFRERWIEDCAGTALLTDEEGGEDQKPAHAQQEPQSPSFEGLLELLERIDVINSGAENGVALEAMKGFWEGRPDYREAVQFDDLFWETLTGESVFMARSFDDFCRTEGDGKYEALLEEKLPEVTKLAFFLERYIKVLIDAIKRANELEVDSDDENDEGDTTEQEFIVEQLLHMALTLDYSDEVGRRKMVSLLRQTLSIPELPDEATRLTVDVLRDICAPDAAGEKEFCSFVLEAVADVHDTIVDEVQAESGERDIDEESFHSARSEVSNDSNDTAKGGHGGGKGKKSGTAKDMSEEEAQARAIKEMMVNMKCLHIVQCMLTNVAGHLQGNDHLVAMLNNLVVPAVRSHEAPVRERGLVCLGLCSLLDRSLAEENLTLFMHFFSKGHAALQITALHILTDILNVHGAQLLSANPALLKVYIKALRSTNSRPEVQAAATVAVSKLLLGRVVTNSDAAAELLRTLVVAYFEPGSAQNQSVRQALNYFLPVFCYARAENQQLMQRVALDALHALYNVREGLDDEDREADGGEADDMVSLTTVGACLVDWTDPRKCYGLVGAQGMNMAADPEKKNVKGDVHLDLVAAILERLRGNAPREEKKVIAPLLGKLHVSGASTEEKIREVYADVCEAVEKQIVGEAAGRNALYKIHVSLGKIVNQLDVTTGGLRASVSGRGSTPGSLVSGGGVRPSVEDRSIVNIKEEEEEEGINGGAGGEDEDEGDKDDEDKMVQGVKAKSERGDSVVNDDNDDDDDDDDEEEEEEEDGEE